MQIDKITVQKGRLLIDVSFAADEPSQTNAQIAAAALAACPTLARHSCKNRRGPTFAHTINCTSVAHLYEHLIIDQQVRLSRNLTSRSFVGCTRWLDEARTRANVAVNFQDDLVALRAVNSAAELLQRILADARAAG